MISSSIPYTTLFNKTPDYSFMKVLGCLCFSYTRPYNSYKLQLRALPCVFLGYSLSQKGHRCLLVPTNQLYIFRYVTFDESKFSFKDGLFLQAPLDPDASYSPILVLPSWALTSPLLPSQFQPATSSPAQSTFPSTARNSNTFAIQFRSMPYLFYSFYSNSITYTTYQSSTRTSSLFFPTTTLSSYDY
jgi:hypothetical protein